jgi:hypothetical protein
MRVYNVTMTDANTEYSQELPAGVVRFALKCRGAYDMKLAFVSGESGTNYETIPANAEVEHAAVTLRGRTLYFQCVAAGQVAEITCW